MATTLGPLQKAGVVMNVIDVSWMSAFGYGVLSRQTMMRMRTTTQVAVDVAVPQIGMLGAAASPIAKARTA